MPEDSTEGDEFSFSRRDVMISGLAVAFGASQRVVAAETEQTSERWEISISGSRPEILPVDTDGDGVSEVAVSDIDRYGPTRPYGLVDKDGNWIWSKNSSGKTVPTATGDVDGDGNPEVIFRDNAGDNWFRPYTHGGDYLWSNRLGDWPDPGTTIDFDDDGKDEVLGVSNRFGYLGFWDDDGSTLWNTRSGQNVEHVLGFEQVTEGDIPELLTHLGESNGQPRKGLQLVTKSGSGTEQVWSYGPKERTTASFATLPDTSSPSILVAYPNSGEVHAVTSEGEKLWSVSTDVTTNRNLIEFVDINGDGYTDTVLCSGEKIRIVDGSSQEKTEISFNESIRDLEKYRDNQLAVLTDNQAAVIDLEGESLVSSSVDIGDPRQIATAQFTSGDPSLVCCGDSRIVALDATVPESESGNITIEDLRLVQTVENTRYDEQEKFETYDKNQIKDAAFFYEDPPSLIAEKATALVFDISGSPSASNLPDEVEFELKVGTDTYTVQFGKYVIENAAKDQNTLLEFAGYADDLSNYPTFELDPDISTIEVNLKIPDSDTSQETEVNRDIVEMPDLNVGFAGIQGDDVAYSGLSETEYDEFVKEVADLFQSMYPTRRVNIVKSVLSKRYHSGSLNPNDEDKTNLNNGDAVRDIIEDAITDSFSWAGSTIDDDSFADIFSIVNGNRTDETTAEEIDSIDVAIGVVPDDYFDEVSGDSGTGGIHYSGTSIQPPSAALVEIRSPSTAPHEAGHHLLGPEFYPSTFAQSNGADTAHANENLRSTKYDLSLSSFESETASPSYMSYGDDEWMDIIAYDEMISDDMSADPPLGKDWDPVDRLFAMFEVTEDGLETVSESMTQQLPATDVQETDVIATVRGVDGEVVSERGFERGVIPDVEGKESETSENIVFGTVPFPEEAVVVDVSAPKPGNEDTETISTTVNPYVDIVQETIFAIPQNAVSIDYDGFKNSISNRLDTADRHISEHRYRSAASVLENVKKKIKEHVESGYDTAPSRVRPKSEIIAMLEFRIDRLYRLAKEGNSQNENKGNGKGK